MRRIKSHLRKSRTFIINEEKRLIKLFKNPRIGKLKNNFGEKIKIKIIILIFLIAFTYFFIHEIPYSNLRLFMEMRISF